MINNDLDKMISKLFKDLVKAEKQLLKTRQHLNKVEEIAKMHRDNLARYKKGFDILSDYFDSISEEEKPKVHKQLKELNL